jgi:hypothetical protein
MILHHISSLLKDTFLDCSYLPASDIEPTDHLIVTTEIAHKKKRKVIKISAFEQQFDPSLLKKPLSDLYYRIHFSYDFPDEVSALALNEMASMLLFLNQIIDWPGFQLDELNNSISYRFNWLVKNSAIDTIQLTIILGNILLILDMFNESIQQIASGQSTFNELLKSIADFGKQIKQTQTLQS